MALSLMPSEIARLVYGYFLEMGCDQAAKSFLEESPYLKEFSNGIKNGRHYSTSIEQKSLLQMFNTDVKVSNVAGNKNLPVDNGSCPNSSYLDDRTKSHLLSYANCLQSISSGLSSIAQGGNFSLPEINIELSARNESKELPRNAQENISPRRKCTTPKKMTPPELNSSFNRSGKSDSQSPISTSSSSSASTLGQPSPEFIEWTVNTDRLISNFLKAQPLHEKLASQINIKRSGDFGNDFNGKSSNSSNHHTDSDKFVSPAGSTAQLNRSDSMEIGNIEKDLLPPETLEEIINSILDEPECYQLVESSVEQDMKEIQASSFPPKRIASTSNGTLVSSGNKLKCFDTLSEIGENLSMTATPLLTPTRKLKERAPIASNKAPIMKATPLIGTFSNVQTGISSPVNVNKVDGQPRTATPLLQQPILRTYGFRSLKNKQREVRIAKNCTKSQSNPRVTRVIEKVNSPPVTTSGSLQSQSPVLANSTMRQKNTPIPSVVLSNWPSPLGQPCISGVGENLILTTLPSANQPIIYMNDFSQFLRPVSTQPIQTNSFTANQLASTNPTSVSLIDNSTVANTSQQTSQGSSSVSLQNQPHPQTPTVQSTEQPNSTLKSLRPSIPGKPKANFIRAFTGNAANMTCSPEESASASEEIASETRSVPSNSDKNVTSQITNTRTLKRKAGTSATETNKQKGATELRNNKTLKETVPIYSPDSKIKTILNMDMDSFLGNIHQKTEKDEDEK